MKYTFKKVYKYSRIVEVEADNQNMAEDKALNMDGKRIKGDTLDDIYLIKNREES